MLFGTVPGAKPDKPNPMAKADAPSGRILRSLIEPPPPEIEDMPEPARRGRKPGSKNKPKPRSELSVVAMGPDASAERPRRGRKPGSKNKPKPQPELSVAAVGPDASAERPRRGRKPGSKNRPKPQPATAFPAPTAHHNSVAAAMRSYGFADDGTVWRGEAVPAPERSGPEPTPAPPRAAPPEGAAEEAAWSRPRLRDRSAVLRRYVLDIEPRPGQPGASRARRLARSARHLEAPRQQPDGL